MEKFNYETNGYNRREVNEFIDNVIKETEDIIEKFKSQQIEIENLKQELNHYKSMEDSLKDAIIRAEEVGDNIKQKAREEANMIIVDSKDSASRIVNDALLKAEKIDMKRENIENSMKIFKRKLKLIMEQQKAIVEEIEILDIDNDK